MAFTTNDVINRISAESQMIRKELTEASKDRTQKEQHLHEAVKNVPELVKKEIMPDIAGMIADGLVEIKGMVNDQNRKLDKIETKVGAISGNDRAYPKKGWYVVFELLMALAVVAGMIIMIITLGNGMKLTWESVKMVGFWGWFISVSMGIVWLIFSHFAVDWGKK